jgi:hypothetical protein
MGDIARKATNPPVSCIPEPLRSYLKLDRDSYTSITIRLLLCATFVVDDESRALANDNPATPPPIIATRSIGYDFDDDVDEGIVIDDDARRRTTVVVR